MKRQLLIGIVVVQVIVLACLAMAVIQQTFLWYALTAATVTALALLAGIYAFHDWNSPG